MLTRAKKLQSTIEAYSTKFADANRFQLDDSEWDQVGYLIDITKLFAFCTAKIGTSNQPTISYAFLIYDSLLEHLWKMKRLLESKLEEWLEPILDGIDAAISKLHKYYKATYNDLGSVYAFGAILSPAHRAEILEQGTRWLDPTRD
jgi:hypothetical protein